MILFVHSSIIRSVVLVLSYLFGGRWVRLGAGGGCDFGVVGGVGISCVFKCVNVMFIGAKLG